jgi:hypothetical protein
VNFPGQAAFQTAASNLSSKAGIWGSMRVAGMSGLMVGLPFAAADAARQKPGERLPTLAGRTMGLTTFPIMSAAFATGLMLVPGIGPVAAAALAPLAAMYPNAMFGKSLARGFREMSQFSRNVRRLEMGGDYQDTLSAKASRMSAIQEMNATLVASRRFLGQEAVFYHQ